MNKENKMTVVSRLFRFAGAAAKLSGILFVVIQTIHPLDILSSVHTDRWAIVHFLGVAMCFCGLLGMTGIYARQAAETGWLGLIGYLALSLFYALTMAFQFVEALISPTLATESPKLEESILAIAGGSSGEYLGALEATYMLTGILYLLGGLLFGIASFRARILSRGAAGLLALGTLLPLPLSSLVHHPYDRFLAVPVGLALAWLGSSLWRSLSKEMKEDVSELQSAGKRVLG
ncbi:hypothetical protein [Cohnella zeiphila]|uniref:DUF4386 domain-containing protein n=1 Tax=Cohnella zeiphila TaxID=2761120 RepID=A0A7X0VXD1_9BACL|nr:hypothetical protein [Cohnella zeiphila]MBB6734154.1 hypothetical protein [Cohnella zeiphila]